jgi:hypothetical protein
MDGLNIPREVTGTWLQDTKGKDFLLVVDVPGDWIKNGEDSAMFHVLVSSLFEFPVITAWREADGWHMGGEQPWLKIAEQTDPMSLRLQKIPISFPETEKKLREREEKQQRKPPPA